MYNILCGNHTYEVFCMCGNIGGLSFPYVKYSFPIYASFNWYDIFVVTISRKYFMCKSIEGLLSFFFIPYVKYSFPIYTSFTTHSIRVVTIPPKCFACARALKDYYFIYLKHSFFIYASSTMCIIFGLTIPPKYFKYVRALRDLFWICRLFLSNLYFLYFMHFIWYNHSRRGLGFE